MALFDAPNGLQYDTKLHDFVEADGTLASVERVAETWEMEEWEVEQQRAVREGSAEMLSHYEIAEVWQ